jgi:hypothetical protein
LAFEDCSIYGTTLVWKDDEMVASRTLSSAISSSPDGALRCYLRSCLRQGFKHREARRVANSSNAAPPDSISTITEPARYWPRISEVTIERPARKSKPTAPARPSAAR